MNSVDINIDSFLNLLTSAEEQCSYLSQVVEAIVDVLCAFGQKGDLNVILILS